MMKQSISKLLILSLTAGSLVIPAALQAQTTTTTTTTSSNTASGESSAKVSDLQKSEEKKKDIDDEITDARMRASLGSKSRFSFKSSLGYSGGSIKEPLATVRPSYRMGVDAEELATLSGNVGVNVRVGDRDNLTFGTGVTVVDPLHGDITKNAQDQTAYGNGADVARYRISTPNIGWSRGYKALGSQMISSVGASYYTADTTTSKGYFGSFSISQTVLANLGSTKWTGGAALTVQKVFYGNEVSNKKYAAAMAAGAVARDEWQGGIYPFMQYAFNDTYSFRTVFGIAEFQRKEGLSDVEQIEPYQSVGIGISITRDIYLYPNIQFTPKDIRDDRTNVALSTNINLF